MAGRLEDTPAEATTDEVQTTSEDSFPASDAPSWTPVTGIRLAKVKLGGAYAMAQLLSVPRAEWRPFFDRMSKALLGKWAEIEVASLDLGDQIVAEWVPMIGITYDSRDDLLDVALDRANHMIRHPREILVEEATTGLASVAVIDESGVRQIVRLKEPLMLPPASAQGVPG